jgi:hypothetical protein
MPPVNQPITLIATVIFSVLVLAGLHAIYGLAVWLLFVLIGLIIGIYVAALRFILGKGKGPEPLRTPALALASLSP